MPRCPYLLLNVSAKARGRILLIRYVHNFDIRVLACLLPTGVVWNRHTTISAGGSVV